MGREEMSEELARLREDVAALKNAQVGTSVAASAVADEPPVDQQPADTVARTQPSAADAPTTVPGFSEELSAQAEELGELLQEEIKNMPAVTSLTVFTLGILLGRYLR